MIRHFIQVCVIACIGIGAFSDVAPARTPYDGNWSVLIVTQRGSCDRAYRYGVQIVNGRVVYNGGVVNFSGRVTARGQVRVSVSSGSGRANGSGRLSRNAGNGRWSGVSGNDRCSGYWTAERRG
ncbi:MAG: hypothetical protein ACRECO_03185 [Xanthobacteraceae bacterium]